MAALAGMSRETRLLAATIAVSVLVLFVLAQFRFPADAEIRSDPAQTQPLARLAARAAFDDLSSAIGQLSTRVGPSLVVLRLSMPPAADADGRLPRPSRYVPALRIRDDTAIVMLPRGARVEGVSALPGPVSVVGHDPVRELALVRIPPEPAQVLTVREGSTPLTAPGYVAVAEAASGGLALRPLFLGRSDMQADPRWDSALLTIGRGAAGDAGAPVFTLDGRLAGIVTLTDGDPVLIPGDLVMASADQMFRGTVVTSGDIGLTVQPLDARAGRAAGTSSGALVAYVRPDGPSHEALWVGDVVTAVNDQPVGNADGLRLRVSRTAPGMPLALTVLRNGSLETVRVLVRARPAMVSAPEGGAPPETPADLGLTLRAVPNTGAEVVRVRPDSAAALAGLRPADLIMSVARTRAPGPAEVSEAWDAMPPGGSIFLGVERAGQAMAVVLEK